MPTRQNVHVVSAFDRRRIFADSFSLNPNFQFSRHQLGAINPCFVPRCQVLLPHGSALVFSSEFPPVMVRMEEESSISLRQLMVNEGLVPSLEEEDKRRAVIEKLRKEDLSSLSCWLTRMFVGIMLGGWNSYIIKRAFLVVLPPMLVMLDVPVYASDSDQLIWWPIVVKWVKKVAWQRSLPKHQIAATDATIMTYGSYGLGVHGSESDLDALCVGPFFATMAEDFFIVLRNMLKSRPEVSEIHCVKDAKVPLMRFKFDGISVDLPYAQLKVLSIPDNVDVLNPFFLRNIDETSWKSLSGVRANKRILQLVPVLETFQSLLRSVKLWAKRRGVYGNLNGFLGGVHMAILAAFVCQHDPNATLSALLAIFFSTFAYWQWPTPVGLQGETSPATGAPPGLMPIKLPCGPHQYCNSNITRSTFYKIRAEFLRGHNLTRDHLKPDFNWQNLFEPFPYTKKYTRFAKIYLSATNQNELGDWVGWVKSRFRCLLIKLEEAFGICDPNPTEYIQTDAKQPNVVFYWGLQSGKPNASDIESMEMDFLKNLSNGHQRPSGRIQLSVIQACQLPKNGQFDSRTKKTMKACWRIREDKHQGTTPVYSQHLPNYVVGFMTKTSAGEAEYRSGGG